MNSVIDIEKIKSDIAGGIIDELISYAASDNEKKLLREELESKIKSNILITKVNADQIEVDADKINQTMNEIYIDLLTTYGVINSISQALSRYNVSYMTYIDSIRAKINEINDKLMGCKHSISHMHMPAFHIENFRSSDKFDYIRALHKDRYGQWIPSRCYVRHDKENCITLPLIRQDNSLRYDDKVATAYVSKHFQLGHGFIETASSETDIENVIDESQTTFWSDTILSDAPFKVSFQEDKPKELFVDDDYFYGIESGAVCELEINFESVNTINEISLSPYTKYPIDIVAIRYKLTDDEDEPLTELVTPYNKQIALRQTTTNSKVSYKFSDILCKKIYILFCQEHYVRDTYIYNPADVYKNELWFNNKNDKRPKTKNAEFKPVYYDRMLSSASWQNVNDRIVSSADTDIISIIIGDKDKNRKVIKYEYEYGFYNIGCFNNHFDRTGFYVSKKIELKSNIKTVKIDTDEVHQLDTLGNHVTDIEYYVTGVENPTTDDWTPIMPKDKQIIESELLFITGGTRAYLRFETDEVICLMKNGEPIPTDSSEYHLDINERTGKIWCVQIFNYDYDAVYSLKYVPEPGHDMVDFSGKISTSIETFYGEDKNKFKLFNDPFIDTTLDYCSIKLTDISQDGTGTEIEVANVTDLTNQSSSYMNFDNSTNKFQFYVHKDTVYFNKPIPKKFLIDISYRHLISSIRLKALFRRNTTKDGWLTPILREIKYDIETF